MDNIKKLFLLLVIVFMLGLTTTARAGDGPYDGFWYLSTNEMLIIEESAGQMAIGLISDFEQISWWAWLYAVGDERYFGRHISGHPVDSIVELKFGFPYVAVLIITNVFTLEQDRYPMTKINW